VHSGPGGTADGGVKIAVESGSDCLMCRTMGKDLPQALKPAGELTPSDLSDHPVGPSPASSFQDRRSSDNMQGNSESTCVVGFQVVDPGL
jgi:hypothetical protein